MNRLRARSIAALFSGALAVPGHAQEPVPLTNNGAPMHVAFGCPEDDLRDAGMLCTDASPCPVYLELNAVASLGDKILAAGDLHSESATLDSILLLSSDGGRTWKEPARRIRGAALDQVQFAGGGNLRAGGETLYPLPRDPFVLLSTDGGGSWHERPVSEDGGPGTVESLRFDSPEHGELTVDEGRSPRGESLVFYETSNGGESWTRRARNGSPKIRTVASDATVRVRTGKDGKAWLIERKEGAGWAAAGTFLIEAARCGGGRTTPGADQ